ncbi:MAG: ABC transporter ATP-binding protein, partial [Gaiellaceae bacterium]
VKRLSAGYGGPPIIHNVDLTVNPCEVVAVLGPNGSGKSTFLNANIGQIQPSPGSVVEAFGQNVTGWGPQRLASLGVGYVPQHNDAFAPLSVRENLEIGGYRLRRRETAARIAEICDLFPMLQRLLRKRVDVLSGGERKMVGIARAWMSAPKLLLFDEPTAGLAPEIGRRVLSEAVSAAAQSGAGIVLVEQRAEEALKLSDHVLVFVVGTVAASGPVEEVMKRENFGELFLGRGPAV